MERSTGQMPKSIPAKSSRPCSNDTTYSAALKRMAKTQLSRLSLTLAKVLTSPKPGPDLTFAGSVVENCQLHSHDVLSLLYNIQLASLSTFHQITVLADVLFTDLLDDSRRPCRSKCLP